MFNKIALLASLYACATQAQSSCPDGWSSVTGTDGLTTCCPGTTNFSEGNCVVGGSSVAFTASGYTSIVSSLAAATGGSTEATTTESSSASTTSMTMVTSTSQPAGVFSGSSTIGTSSAVVAASSSSSSTSSGGAAVTGMPMVGVLGAIGGAAVYLL